MEVGTIDNFMPWHKVVYETGNGAGCRFLVLDYFWPGGETSRKRGQEPLLKISNF